MFPDSLVIFMDGVLTKIPRGTHVRRSFQQERLQVNGMQAHAIHTITVLSRLCLSAGDVVIRVTIYTDHRASKNRILTKITVCH